MCSNTCVPHRGLHAGSSFEEGVLHAGMGGWLTIHQVGSPKDRVMYPAQSAMEPHQIHWPKTVDQTMAVTLACSKGQWKGWT